MFLNVSHNSEDVDLVFSSTGRPQENRIFRFLKIQVLEIFKNSLVVHLSKQKSWIQPCSGHLNKIQWFWINYGK